LASPYRSVRALIHKTQPHSKKIAHKALWVEPELLAKKLYRPRARLRVSLIGLGCPQSERQPVDRGEQPIGRFRHMVFLIADIRSAPLWNVNIEPFLEQCVEGFGYN
jgi:hypothetical protein